MSLTVILRFYLSSWASNINNNMKPMIDASMTLTINGAIDVFILKIDLKHRLYYIHYSQEE